MSIYLILTTGLLLLGSATAALLAWRRPRYAPLATAVSLALALLVWLIAGQNLPLGSGLARSQGQPDLLSLLWTVDHLSWRLSFFLLLMVLSIIVVSMANSDRQEWPIHRERRKKSLYPAILLVSASALLTVWAGSIASLLVTWVVLALTWLFLLWSMTEEPANASRLLPRAAALLSGALFLWLAVATSGAQGSGEMSGLPSSGSAVYLLLLAAIAPLGAIPLHWWRPLAWSLPSELAATVHLAPVVAGGSLLVRIGGEAGLQNESLVLLATLLGLVSALGGISIAWMYVASPARSLSGLALAQAGVVILAAAWAGSLAALAATQVLILAISGLFHAARWSPRKTPWPAIIPLLALAGFPLTAGVDGLAAVYDAWLDSGSVVLLLPGVLLSMFLLAAGVLVVRREMPSDELVGRSNLVKARHYLALSLPSLGLLSWPGQPMTDIAVVAWLTVVIAIGGSLIISRFEAQIHDAQLTMRRALHFGATGRRLTRLLAAVGSALDSAVREAAGILEGEGGMLWLLVFLVVVWLARR